MDQLKLFDDTDHILLPQELMDYNPSFLSREASDRYLKLFLDSVPWQQNVVTMYEKEVVTPRLSAWFGERPIRKDDQRIPVPWTPELLENKSGHRACNRHGIPWCAIKLL